MKPKLSRYTFHRLDDKLDVLIQIHPQFRRSAVDLFPVHGTGKGLVLQLLLHRGQP